MKDPSHERSPRGLLLLLLTLVGASMFVKPRHADGPITAGDHRSVEPEMRHGSTTSASASETDTDRLRRLRAPLAEFLGVSLDGMNRRDQIRALIKRKASVPFTLEFMIACVPDPVDSVVGYRFDILMDTLQ